MQIRNTIEFYQGANNLHYWRYRHRNGRILADSGQGYRNYGDAHKGANTVTHGALLLGLVRVVQVNS